MIKHNLKFIEAKEAGKVFEIMDDGETMRNDVPINLGFIETPESRTAKFKLVEN